MKTSALVLSFCIAFPALPAAAANATWTGAAGDWLWTTDANWDANAVPTSADTAYVNAGTMESPVLIGPGETASPIALRIATGTDSAGAVSINNGSLYIEGTHDVIVGDKGTGIFLLNGQDGTFRIPRQLYLGSSAGSSGTFLMTGGTISMGRDGYVGESGTGLLRLEGGTTTMRDLTIGHNASGRGTVVFEDGAIYRATSNGSTYVGDAGYGELHMRGGSASPVNTYARLVIRDAETGIGLLHGWGSWNTGNKTPILNNGLVIADGEGTERTLSLLAVGGTSSLANNIDNDSTNGWYAVRKGLLDLRHRVNLPTGDSGTTSWGEAADDEVIDLVNSARFDFHDISGKNGILSLYGQLYAPDRSEAFIAALPVPAAKLGIWSFSLSDGGCSTYDLTFRYDHVAAAGLALSLKRWNGSAWDTVDGVTWDSANYLAKATGLTPDTSTVLGTFAIVGAAPSTCVLIR